MKFADNKGIKFPKLNQNAGIHVHDMLFVSHAKYQNTTILLSLLAQDGIATESNKDTIISGLRLDWSATMNCNLRAGSAVSFTGKYIQSGIWSFAASPGEIFSVTVPLDETLSFTTGGAQDRIDIVEIRPFVNTYDTESRQFYDPIEGNIVSALVQTMLEVGYEARILEGVEGGTPAAPANTAGWIKIAEVYVGSGVSALTQANVQDVQDADLWTTGAGDLVHKVYIPTADRVGLNNANFNETTVEEALANFTGLHTQARLTTDFTTSGAGTISQRVLCYNNLTFSHNTTLKSRCVYVHGDLTIDGGVVITVEPLHTLSADDPKNAGPNFAPGGVSSAGDHQGVGGFCALNGDEDVGGASAGGGGFGASGGAAQSGGKTGGVSAGAVSGGAGGAGGVASGNDGGGGGGGFGGGGGRGGGDDGGRGGNLIIFIVGGNFINEGTINCNGSEGDAHASGGGGGGGGGAVVVIAYGDSPTIGIINCDGGAGGNVNAGGGGGGHIELYARTSSWGTLGVAGGAGDGDGDAGSEGTIWTADLDSSIQVAGGMLATTDQQKWAGHLFKYLEGLF